MCRWGCPTTNTTFMCKWCGTWFCRECLKGAFYGQMYEPLKCRVCNQKKCQGTKVDFLIKPPPDADEDKKGSRSGSRGRSGSPSKSSKGAKGSKSSTGGKKSGGKKSGGKKSGGKKSGKKSGKKKKKK